ncbi:hypothetical protein EV386_2759 [Xylanimonas ulmi]|uniref:Uncharacterized protein n=2 Tax=Xylanimonas ulmi TaxID=228973 RepID=A0A4Q7M3D4_9MICO|nr:hypothetical protein EV386_2759 [Xylanibacterium ulmi]
MQDALCLARPALQHAVATGSYLATLEAQQAGASGPEKVEILVAYGDAWRELDRWLTAHGAPDDREWIKRAAPHDAL